MEQKIILSPKKIVAKEFKVDFKGYNAEEVDHFLKILILSVFSLFFIIFLFSFML